LWFEVLIYLIIHALNKAFLFVLVGYIVHFFSGNTDMRQMGGFYIYSFDVSVLLLGVCFNLAGLPYSAGFLGKEFLLFQVLRDDFLSIITRGCWLVSFFFTPIYMFILVFKVAFGPKKGSIIAYRSGWSSVLAKQVFVLLYGLSLVNNFNTSFSLHNLKLLSFKFQFTIITSRKTSYLLFFFWIFFWCLNHFIHSVMLFTS
jgi:formate hydrogenlyase subunit 3/multisubunit Na+/H+ antiporter MnhD subunit